MSHRLGPSAGRVMVRADEKPVVECDSGISTGIVIGVGSSVESMLAGQRVVYLDEAAYEMSIDGGVVVVMVHADDVLAVF